MKFLFLFTCEFFQKFVAQMEKAPLLQTMKAESLEDKCLAIVQNEPKLRNRGMERVIQNCSSKAHNRHIIVFVGRYYIPGNCNNCYNCFETAAGDVLLVFSVNNLSWRSLTGGNSAVFGTLVAEMVAKDNESLITFERASIIMEYDYDVLHHKWLGCLKNVRTFFNE